MALSKKNRLKKKKDLDAVFKEGKAVRGSFLFIKYKINELGYPRFAFVVSSKVARKAVERNKIRRILSGAAAPVLPSTGSYDFIILANAKIRSSSKQQVQEDFLGTLKKIN